MNEETTILNRLLFVISVSIIEHLITCTDGEELFLDSISECDSTSVQLSSPNLVAGWTHRAQTS